MSTYRKYRSSSGGYRRSNAGKVVIWCLVIFLVISIFPVLFSMSGPADREPTEPQTNTSNFIVENATFLTYKFHEDLTAPFFGEEVDSEYHQEYPIDCRFGDLTCELIEVEGTSDAYAIVIITDNVERFTVYTSVSGWVDEKYRDFHFYDPYYSPYFIDDWIAVNADPVFKKLSGTWEFNDSTEVLHLKDGYYISLPFYFNNVFCEYIEMFDDQILFANFVTDWTFYDSFGFSTEFHSVTFDGNVYVPVDFYDFVITNATRVS